MQCRTRTLRPIFSLARAHAMSSSSHRHFETSDHSAAYALYRSSPPPSLVEKVAAHVRSGSRALAVDVGCGTGQSTFVLADYFDRVSGVDVSESQIEEARRTIANNKKAKNVEFRVGSDGKLDFADGSVDLVTSCQAVHWFDDICAFYTEADRVLRPGGAIAVFGYHFTDPVSQGEGEGGVERFVDHRKAFYASIAHVFDSRRKLVDEAYTTIPQLIYEDRERDESHFVDIPDRSLKDYLGYISTWSGFRTYSKTNDGEKLLHDFAKGAKEILGVDPDTKSEDIPMRLRTRYFLLLGRKSL